MSLFIKKQPFFTPQYDKLPSDPICVTYLASNDHVKPQCVENTVKCLEAVGDSMIQQSALESALGWNRPNM